MKIRTKICPLMEFRLLLLVFTEERAQKPRIQNKTCVQVLAVIYWTLSCMNIESHLCMFVRVRVIVPEMPPTLTAVVTPSSVVLCPFCQDKQMRKSRSVWMLRAYITCVWMGLKEEEARHGDICKTAWAAAVHCIQHFAPSLANLII